MSTGAPRALPRWRVEEYPTLASTQQLLKQRLADGHDVDGLVVRAAEQPAGAGRRGKAWSSPPGGSYQSLGLKDRWSGALQQPALTLLLAVELAEALRAAGAQAKVKWPNDLYLGNGKLAGLLSEYVGGHLIVGIGVNVTNPVPASGARLSGWRLQFVNELVLDAARSALERQVNGAATDELPARLAPLDQLADRRVTVRTAHGVLSGIALGVTAAGALRLRAGPGVTEVADGSVVSWQT